jgi:hypothetical protein
MTVVNDRFVGRAKPSADAWAMAMMFCRDRGIDGVTPIAHLIDDGMTVIRDRVRLWCERPDIAPYLHPAMAGLLEKYMEAQSRQCQDWNAAVTVSATRDARN